VLNARLARRQLTRCFQRSRSIRCSVLALQPENRQKAASHNLEGETKARPPLGHSRVLDDSVMEPIKNSVSCKGNNYDPQAAFETNPRGQQKAEATRDSRITTRPEAPRAANSTE
jgi:hypothetical protein